MWIEQVRDDGWVAAYRVMAKGDRLVIAEVRLLPHEPTSGPGRWSEDASKVSGEGVPGKALGGLRLSVPRERFGDLLRRLKGDSTFGRVLLASFSVPQQATVARRRPGRAGRPDAYYLPWVVAYVQRLAKGSPRPIKDLAEKPPARISGYVSDGDRISKETVSDLIHQARKRGLLTPSPIGRPGGELTAKAKALLKSAKKGKSKPAA
jgi:hypothetical protein